MEGAIFWSGRGRYIYTFENICREEPELTFGDESYKVVVNTKGHKGEIPDELKEALKYLEDGSITGDYSRELDDAVKAVKSNEERRLEYMMLTIRDNEMREEGREEGLAEGREEGEDYFAALIKKLYAAGRGDEVQKAAEDKAYRAELFKEFQLN